LRNRVAGESGKNELNAVSVSSRHGLFEIEFLTPNKTDTILLGEKLWHFEMVSHEAPPRWRLKGERKKFYVYETPLRPKSQEKIRSK
jgi:hypothetical protein